MNKQELFEKISDLDEITIHVPTNMNLTEVNYLRKPEVLELIEQLDEPKKPVIPQFVADWIEKQQAKRYSLRDAIAVSKVPENVRAWLIKPYENQEIFARAWLDGYEIEKEKLYTVEIPNPNAKNSRIVLQRLRENALHLKEYTGEDWKGYMMNQLTESEIKQDFEWAWEWAEEVEE